MAFSSTTLICTHLLFCATFISTGCTQPEASADKQGIVVETKYGRVRGTTRQALSSTRTIYTFFGVPYGRSPDYAFRFIRAENPWSWEGIKDSTDEQAAFCQQDKESFSKLLKDTWLRFVTKETHPMKEDCLTVNVFTPVHPSKVLEVAALPVIVWIHGGSLQKSATSNKMWMMPAFEDVVVVAIQYRIGVFGFYTMEDENASGNIGLFDQIKALEWIRDNIRRFGGDPGAVTIIGSSAGGFAVSAHTLSPMSHGLFHRAVAMSGVASLPPMIKVDQQDKALEITKRANCSFWANSHAITCLRNHVTSSELVRLSKENKSVFVATVDKKFLPDSVDLLLMEQSFNVSVPIMIGGVTGEFDFVLARNLIPGYQQGINDRTTAENLIKSDFETYYPNQSESLIDLVVAEYLDGNSAGKTSYTQGVVDYFADSWFHSQSVRVASTFKRAGARVYFYEFSAKPSFYENKDLFPRPHDYNRADHTDSTLFFFGFPFLPGLNKAGVTFTEKEKILSRSLMKMLATFARTGSPSDSELQEWPLFPSYAFINETITTRKDFRSNRMKIWSSVSYSKHKDDFCDASKEACKNSGNQL